MEEARCTPAVIIDSYRLATLSRVIDVVNELKSYGVDVFVCDPLVTAEDVRMVYGVELSEWDDLPVADAVVVAVAHDEFLNKSAQQYAARIEKGGCFIDVKSKFDMAALHEAGLVTWRL